MVKKHTSLLFGGLVLLGLILAACSSAATTTTESATGSDLTLGIAGTPGAQSTPDFSAMATQQASTALEGLDALVVGTFRLEETEYAVDATQAKTLIVLWQAYTSLSASSTTAAAELEALVKQLESSLTAEQHAAVDAMNLTAADQMALMQTLGLDFAQRNMVNAEGTPQVAGEGFPAGGFPEGAPADGGTVPGGRGGGAGGFAGGGPGGGMGGGMAAPGGDGGGFVGGDMGGEAGGLGLGAQVTPDATMQAQRQSGMGGGRFNTVLIQALIELLQAKVAAAGS